MKLKRPTCKEIGHWFTDPIVRTKTYFVTLVAAFGWRFVLMVMFGEHLLKGFMNGGGDGGFFNIEDRCYMQLKIGSADRTILSAISGSPWSLKPLFGMLSDTVVLRGFRRTQWVIITAFLAFISYSMVLAFGKSIPPSLLAMCFFFGRLQCAWTDLMVEAVYTERIQTVPEHASAIVTWVWAGIGVGGVIAFLILGACLDKLGPFTSMAIPLSLSILPAIPALLGWMCETPCNDPRWGIRFNIIREQKQYFMCGCVLSAAVLVAMAAGIARLKLMWKCVVACVNSAGVIIAAVYFLPHALWGPMVYMFLANALAIRTTTFATNFYLDAPDKATSDAIGYPICVDCPHFDNYFYITVVGVVDMVFTAVGSWMFNAYISTWTYRGALIMTELILVVASLMDIVQYERWNKHIGIPDWVFMIGKEAVQNTTYMLHFMPTFILLSKLCPPGLESTIFSLLAGFSNYGGSVAKYIGAYVVTAIGLGDIGNGAYDDFSNAWIACLINVCLPIVMLFTLPFLIPNARMTDNLQRPGKNEEFSKEEGSSHMSEGGNDLMDTEMEAGDYVAGQLTAPTSTPMGFTHDDLQQTNSSQRLMQQSDEEQAMH